MAVAVPASDYAQLLFRTAPFRDMASPRRIQLLSQARSARFLAGEQIFTLNEVPTEVFLLLEGRVCVFGDFIGENDPVLLEEMGPGACLGWSAALAADSGLHAMATSEVRGLWISAPGFVEIGRDDAVLREAFFARPCKAEVWRALLSETDRRLGELRSVREVVDELFDECVVRDWPDETADEGYTWVVAGGEGATRHGDRWSGGDGVLWARLLGFPEARLAAAIENLTPRPLVGEPMTGQSPVAPKKSGIRAAHALPVSTQPFLETRPTPQPNPAQMLEDSLDDDYAHATMRTWPLVVLTLLLALACGAWWASTQPVIQPLTIKGRVVFRGETRPLPAAMTGTLTEFRVASGQHVKRGEALAIIQPPVDEAQLKALQERGAKGQAAAEFCAAVLAGQTPATAPVKELSDLAREYAREQSNVRVQNAIVLGRADAPDLTLEERRFVNRQIAKSQESRNERVDSANRDASVRREDLQEAEQSLREAQEEVRLNVDSFASSVSDNKKEAARELADHQRALGVLQRQVAQRALVVNRLRKEIATIQAEPAAAEPLPMVNNSDLDRARLAVTAVETKFRAAADAARQQIADSEEATARLREESGPRQVLIRQTGRITEAAKLKPGMAMTPETELAKFVTQDAWQIELKEPLPGQLPIGHPVRIAAAGEGATVEPLHYSDATRTHLRLADGKREWHDGSIVQVETSVVKGTLLEQWMGQLN
jgi:multidrug resistance efflux pump